MTPAHRFPQLMKTQHLVCLCLFATLTACQKQKEMSQEEFQQAMRERWNKLTPEQRQIEARENAIAEQQQQVDDLKRAQEAAKHRK